MNTTIQMQMLLGTVVKDVNGAVVGRIEEIAATHVENEMLVDGYIAGSYGLASRMSVGSSLHWLTRLLGMNARKGHFIPWDKLDLSDPARPVTTCAKDALKPPSLRRH